VTDEAHADHVRVIEAALSDLPSLASEWSDLGVADRATAEYEWSEAMARLHHLVTEVSSGRLDLARQVTVSKLRHRLDASLAAAQSIGLSDPRMRALADAGIEV
jgi:hypothetical protein